MSRTPLLMDESPLQVLPSLAKLFGLNEAIFLQQLHYQLTIVRRTHNAALGNPKVKKVGKIDDQDQAWYFNTLDDWQEGSFPFWSRATLKRVIARLKKLSLIRTTAKWNEDNIDRRMWYTINYYQFDVIIQTGTVNPDLQESQEEPENEGEEDPAPLDQSEPIGEQAPEELKMSLPSAQSDPMDRLKMSPPLAQIEPMLIKYSETPLETPSENPLQIADPPPKPQFEPGEAWKMIDGQLRADMDERSQAYREYVKTLQVSGLENGVFRLKAASTYARDWAASRLRTRIRRLLEGIYGQPLELEITIN